MTTITPTAAFKMEMKKAKNEQRLFIALGMSITMIATASAAISIVPPTYPFAALAMLAVGLLQVGYSAYIRSKRWVTTALPVASCVAAIVLIAAVSPPIWTGALFLAIGVGRFLATNPVLMRYGWDWCAGSAMTSIVCGGSFLVGLPEDAPQIFSAMLSIDLFCQGMAVLDRAIRTNALYRAN